MKKIFLIFLLFSLPSIIYSQNFWECKLWGTSWSSITLYEEEGIILIAGSTGIFISMDDGENWGNFTRNIIPDINHMAKNDNDVTFAATFLGVYRSTNIGVSWDTVNNGFQNLQFIRVFPENDRVFAGNLFGEIYKSTNLGESWTLIKQLTPYNYPYAYLSNDNYIFFGINSVNFNSGGVIRSSDGGGTWEVVNNGLAIPSVHALSKNGQGEIFAGSNDGIYISSDNGNLWTNISNGIDPHFGITCIKILDNSDIYIGCDGYPGIVYRSTNNGESWVLINGGMQTEIIYFVDISPSGYLFAGSYEVVCGLNKSVLPIPVELSSFIAELSDNNAYLWWSTATETNNSGFEIQRKESGVRSRESEWNSIGFVPGYGTTTEPQFYYYIDESLQPGKYQYRLKQIDYDGSFEYSKIVEVIIETPQEFSLSQNYPNPFNPTTKIKYQIPLSPPLLKGESEAGGFITLKIYDVLGNEVETLVNEEKPAGEYEVEFRAEGLPSGIYFYQLKATPNGGQAGDFIQTKKMILLK